MNELLTLMQVVIMVLPESY